ncbi:MAG: hypothetical protein V4511_15430 [Bacteroidota bacterium]
MFKNLTYKKKNQLLIIVSVLALYLIYAFAVKKTIAAYSEYCYAEKQIELAANAPVMAVQLENQLLQMDSKIGKQNVNGQNTEQALLELITNYCQNNHAVLREFPETTIAKQGDLFIETNLFVVEGEFASLINLVYILEQKNKLGKIASVRYQLKKDFKTKDMTLTAAIYLQNVKQHEK